MVHSSTENFQPGLQPNSEPEADNKHVSQSIANANVSCRDFVLKRAKNYLGNKFYHKGTGHIIETDRYTWNVQVAKCFGGLHVACGGYVVWSASWGWFAVPCN